MLTAGDIKEVTKIPERNIHLVWPFVIRALEELEISNTYTQVVAAATIIVETGCFLPVEEHRANKDKQPDLYARQATYWAHHGRGLIQLTGRANYAAATEALNVDLLNKPDLLMDPEISARVLAWFFRNRGVDKAAEDSNWLKTRVLVNGCNKSTGLPNGWDRYMGLVMSLLLVEAAHG